MKLPDILKRDYIQNIIMIVAVIVAVLIFWFGLRFAFRTDYPILAVASGSMEPVLYAGDLIFVEGVQNYSDIYVASEDANPPGDILVYQGTKDLIVHRAIDKKIVDGKIVFIIHGDANPPGAREQVTEDRIVGRYVGLKVPWMGNIALFFEPLEMKIAFITLWIILLITIELLPSIRKKDRNGYNQASLYK